MDKKKLGDVWVNGKKVFLRVDYNVPMDKEGNITDDTRIRATIPTIEYLLSRNTAIIIASHLGRPKGKVAPEFSLKPVAEKLSKLMMGRPVQLAPDCVGKETEIMAKALQPGQILMLENLRFHAEEEKNDPLFSKQLADLADIAVNDAFGVSHRAHASVEGITKYIPAYPGFLMEKEIMFIGKTLEDPNRPFAAIIGGAKVSDKIGVIENLLNKVDILIIGGGMANTFLAAQGHSVGSSLVETDKLDLARSLMEQAKTKGMQLLLPVDFIVADRFAADAAHQVVAADQIPDGWMALDIGPATGAQYAAAVQTAKTVIWNGPMGVFEMDAFAAGTKAVAQAVADSSATSIVGGGDSIAALEKMNLARKITHISTGGGASLEYLEGKVLPGIAALQDK